MNNNTKDEILQYIIKHTEAFRLDQDLSLFTTHNAAAELKISRTLASSYLNSLVKEKILIKIACRPVYFFHLKTIEKKYQVHLEGNEYDFPEDFFDLLGTSPLASKHENIIGYEISLNYCMSQCQSAIKYPGTGVPVLLWGESGTGKSHIAKYLYDYARDNQSLRQNAPFKIFECTEQDRDSEADCQKLFGEKGILGEAADGILFINNIHRMSRSGQEMLSRYMKKTASDTCDIQVKFIFSSCENPAIVMHQSLLAQIPVISFIPPLRERSSVEKKMFLMHFFQKEKKNLKCSISISGQVYRIMMKYPFDGNLTQLKSYIKVICANAYLQSKPPVEKLSVRSLHLPNELLVAIEPEEETVNEQSMISVTDFQVQESSNYVIPFLERILDIFRQYLQDAMSMNELIRRGTDYVNEFYDYLVFERKYSNSKVKAMEDITGKVLLYISRRYSIFLPANCGFVIARLVYVMTGDSVSMQQWSRKRMDEIEEYLILLRQEFSGEALMAGEIRQRLEELLDMELSEIIEIFFVLNIKFYNRNQTNGYLTGLIIAHGYSAASSIADSVNKLLGKHVLDAFDMPLNTDINEIVSKIKVGIQNGTISRNLIIMVDMGSLEELGKILCESFQLSIGVLNNISTKTALSIGEGISNGVPMEEILSKTCVDTQIQYELYNNPTKEPAILFTSESGVPMTDRVLQIFRDSLPQNLHIRLQSLDITNLMETRVENIFSRYDVMFVTGTMDMHIMGVPYIALEDIISNDAMEDMNNLLQKYMTPEELFSFNEKLLQNFTLQNVIQYLTILNADKLLEHIRDAVEKLQGMINCRFSVKTVIGIYIHVCCLVERLVTKTPISSYENLEGFVQEKAGFINLLTESFRELAEHYNVELPASEIAYLYDYVCHDKNVMKLNIHLE